MNTVLVMFFFWLSPITYKFTTRSHSVPIPFFSLTERIASVEAALSSLSNSSHIVVAPDTGKEATKPTYVTYNFIGRPAQGGKKYIFF